MGLFSTLLLDAENNNNTPQANNQNQNRNELPTVVQLCTFEYSFPLSLDTAPGRPLLSSALLYTAVQTTTSNNNDNNKSLLVSPQQQQHKGLRKSTNTEPLVPDLGVWTCDTSHSSLVDALLPMATNNNNACFSMVVDLTQHLERVEPSLHSQQAALVRHLIQHPSKSSNSHTATTSLYDLKVTQFGRANQDTSESSPPKTQDSDGQTKIALMLSVLWSKNMEEDDDPKELQSKSLLLYHLRKFALAVKASLVLVSETNTATNNNNAGITISQLPVVWKEWALGKAVWEFDSVEAMINDTLPATTSSSNAEEKEPEETSTTPQHTLLYGPAADPQLVEGVLLRNATYPGNWDATKDSVWKILPAVVSSQHQKASSNVGPGGDQGWLQELRESMATVALQTPQKQPSNATANNKTPNDPAVSDFFNDLLNSK